MPSKVQKGEKEEAEEKRHMVNEKCNLALKNDDDEGKTLHDKKNMTGERNERKGK